MKIAVNTRLLLEDKLEGIGWFTHETLLRITQQHPEHRFYFLFDRPYSQQFIYSDNITPITAFPPARHPYLWYLFFEYGIPYQLHKIKPDLFLSTDGWISLRSNIKTVNVIHDLNFEHHPEFINPTVQQYYKKFFHRFAQQSSRLATVSEYTKADLHQLYDIPLDNIDVVYNGCNTSYKPLDKVQKEIVKAKYADCCNYFLFVGLIHKRKNLANIFRAYEQFRLQNNETIKLVVVGNKKWWKGEIEDTYNKMQFRDDVVFMGHINSDVLCEIMSAALALVYTSLFEGFGIPILEAFHAETAVITSNLTSMPEVAGDAACLVDPYSTAAITEAMQRIYQNPDYREQLIIKGRSQRQKFSWNLTADALWRCIENVLYEKN